MFFQLILDNVNGAAVPALPSLSLVAFGGYFLLGVLALVVISFGIYRLLRAIHKPGLAGLSREQIKATWDEIEKTAGQGVIGAKVSLMEADKLLDGVLKSMLIPGDTMAERLKFVAYKYRDINRVWNAHKLRNQLVHDSSFEISLRQTRNALAEYKAALKLLNVL